MEEWIASQKETTHHKIAIILFPITLFLGYIHSGLFGFGLFLFFIITSFKLLKKMLFFMIILGLISVILPFLAPIIFIVMLVLFFMRIQFVIKNWRPFLAGLLIYGIAAILLTRMSFDPTSTLVYDSSFSKLMESIIVSALGFIGIRTTLIWLYGHNYSSYTALGIMGSVPLIIISFILPFLKMHMGGDVYVAEPGVVDGHAVTGETVVHSSDAHITKGANLQHVQPHVRTAPDGDVTNNLSYHGPDAKPVNPDTVAVKGYVRTAPDGDITNNLSYHGPDAKTVNVEAQGNNHVKTSLDGDTAISKGSSQWDDMTPEQKETVMTAFNGVAVGQGMVDKVLKGVERGKGRNDFCGHCGKERSGKGRFCVSCGGSLEYDEQTPKQTNDRKRGNFIVVGIIGVIVVTGALFMAKSSLFTNDEKVATSTEFSEDMETEKLSTAALSDIDGYWVDKGVPSYVGIKITGDKRGEITFYSGEENTTYLFKLQNSEEKKMSLRIYEEKSNVASFVPFNARVNIVDDQQIELIRLGQEEDNLSLTRMTKDEFMNYYEPVDEKKAYTGKNEQSKNEKTKIPFVQIESSWINTSGGPNISFILAEGERSGELIIEQGQPGGGRLPQHKFYISSEPKDGDNTYIISLQQTSGEYQDVELTLTEDRLRMKMDGQESFYQRG
ncbi:energy-coupling factor transporter transmembrane protein EcfT [Bacillus cereus group sp. BfR-BA-01350]|uniref:energy-coupling factor transporter transmembrane protein EcfT n=1 Tax=Bacillus cereus group sp. BfR-BA-01350 TaxID=2920313 RepID=UPI001F58CA9F|nr:energy-coupling factor transporter transmembrane protein EcfT [Bacillus cereus group sp. BfR-BA-01350]